MTENEYAPRPAAVVIERKRAAANISVRAAAKEADLSEGRWRQIAKGYQRAAKGVDVPVNAPDSTLARMALAVGVTTEEMVLAGEQGVADQMYDAAAIDVGAGYILNRDAYDKAIDELYAWAAGDGEGTSTHPPTSVLALWTPTQLADALNNQVAQLEKEFMVQLRGSYGRVRNAGSDLAIDTNLAAHLAEPRLLKWRAAQEAKAEHQGAVEYIDRADIDPDDYVVAASDADHDPEVEAWQEEP